MSNFQEKVFSAIDAFTSERHIVAIKNGMMAYVPFTIVGAFAMLVAAFPLSAYTNFMTGIFGDGWQSTLYAFNNGMMNLGGIICLLFISFELSRQFEDINVNPIYPAVISLGVYFYMTNLVSADGATAIALSKLGAGSLIVSIIIGLCIPELFRFFVKKKLTIKLPSSVPPMIAESFVSVVPLALIMIIAFLCKKLIGLTGYEDIHTFVNTVLGIPFKGLVGSFPGFVILQLVTYALWGFGVHGTNIIMTGLLGPFLVMMSDENRLAFEAGQVLPNIITKQFPTFIISAAGSICIACLIVAKSKSIREVAKAGLIPVIFCITEPLVFGLPIAFNPYLQIAYVVIPVFGAIVTYLSMAIGLVPKLNGLNVPWTTPIGIAGFLMTNSWKGAVWQILLNVCYVLIAIPFVKMYDRQKLREEEMKKDDE